MKISYKGDYAIKSLVYLASKYSKPGADDRYCQISEISKTQDVPVKFLEQILLSLKNAGFVKSHRGKNGGYAIAKAPELITLGEVIRHMDGPTAPIACVSKSCYKYCNFENKCVLKPVWREVRDAISNIVDRITFKDLADKEEEMKRAGADKEMYYI